MMKPKSPQDVLAMTQAVEILLNRQLISFGIAAEIAAMIFDVETDKKYNPMFHIFSGNTHYKLRGIIDGGFDSKCAKLGTEFAEFVKELPPYGSNRYLSSMKGWCVCMEADHEEFEWLPPNMKPPDPDQVDIPF